MDNYFDNRDQQLSDDEDATIPDLNFANLE